MYPSRITGYQDPLSLKAFFLHPSVSLSSFINLVAKFKIFIKIIMYVLSHGCLLNSYKAFFHLHTWLCMSYGFTSSGCTCLFVVYALYPMMFPSTAWWNYELSFMYRYCILDIILLGYFFMARRFCINDAAAFIILFFILKCHHLFFRTSLILLCL